MMYTILKMMRLIREKKKIFNILIKLAHFPSRNAFLKVIKS